MSDKDVQRAKTMGHYRDGQLEPVVPPGKKLVKCFYPPCREQVTVDSLPPSPLVTSKPQPKQSPFCPKHTELVQFLLWAIPKITIQRGQPGGLVVPGNPQFKAGP